MAVRKRGATNNPQRGRASNKVEQANDPGPREIELKLAYDPAAAERLLGSPLLKDAKPAPEAGGPLHAIYFDTKDGSLRKAGLSVRVRRQGERWIQTIKAEAAGRGLVLDRSEWETTVEGPELDFAAAKGTALGDLLKEKDLKRRIKPAFEVRTDRQAFLIERNGAAVEAVVDRATIEARDRSETFGEVELELKAGEPPALFKLALDLVDAAPLRLSLATKAERGYALADKDAPKAFKAERIDLPPGLSTAEAFQAIARSCLTQALRNEALVRATPDSSALHQLRVGLRRLRAATSLFKDMLDDAESDGIRASLRTISHDLGAVRDLDVLVERLRKADDPEQAGVLAEAEERRQAAYRDMMADLDGPRYRRAMLATAAWVEAGDWLTSDDPETRSIREEPIEERATGELAKRWKRVVKRAKRLAELDPEARHRVRIEIKKLRYGAEFFQGLYPGQRSKTRRKEALEGLQHLQELLGELNDIAVGGDLLGSDALSPDAHDEDPRVADLVARAQKDYRRLAGVKPFWE
jgi:inorganic triphosphatase YgiF